MATAALYLRVSTEDQTTENQVAEVRALLAARGYPTPVVFEETGSVVRHRPVFEKMMTEARAGRVSCICVWSLDRLGRGFAAFDTFRELSRLNVRLLSVREPWTDVEGPTRDLLAAVMSWVSGFERSRLIERTKAGLERARRQGKILGRPRLSRVTLGAAAADVEAGMSQRGAARNRGISEAALRAHLRSVGNPSGPPSCP